MFSCILGKILEKLQMPGFVRPFRYYDGETGQVVEVKTSPFYTEIVVGHKEFFFTRETGKYDGFGSMSVEDAKPTSNCKLVARSKGSFEN